MPPKALSAYFIFAGEVRQTIHDEIAATNDGKASVALVGKAIGERWKQLSDEEKKRYQDKAKELKEQIAAAAAVDDDNTNEEAPPQPKHHQQQHPFGFPLSLVKKLACLDPEVDRIASDAVKMLSAATSLFIELLASKSLAHAENNKRKNFKFSDVEAIAKKDRRLVDMGLGEMLAHDSIFEQVRSKEDGQDDGGGGGKRKKKVEEEEGEEEGTEGAGKKKQRTKEMKPLTDFFTATTATTTAVGDPNTSNDVAGDDDNEEKEEEEM